MKSSVGQKANDHLRPEKKDRQKLDSRMSRLKKILAKRSKVGAFLSNARREKDGGT